MTLFLPNRLPGMGLTDALLNISNAGARQTCTTEPDVGGQA